MKKRLFALLMAVAMCISMLPTVAMAADSAITFTVTATNTAPNKGDVVEFVVTMKGTKSFYGIEATLDLPEGVEYVAESGVLNGATVAAIGGDSACEFNEVALQIWLENSSTAMFVIGNLEILRFQCKVNTAGEKAVSLKDFSGTDNDFNDLDSSNVSAVAAVVNVVSPVSGVSLDKETLSLDTGDNKTGTLTATVSPEDATNKNVTWASDNERVATVANGVVTAVKHGTANITVTTEDGGYTDTCVVTVACAHTSKTTTEAEDSDCKTKGWDEYSTCDDCGQKFDASGKAIAEIPYRELSTQHTGGTATCKDKAVCTVCGKSYGELGQHDYTKQDTAEKYLKTAANCKNAAVYYYSCSVCGENEKNDNHTFQHGEKDNTNHIDVQNGWQTDDTYHWGTCSCGAEISKAKHEGGTANCHAKAVCTVCETAYGQFDAANHDGETDLKDYVAATCTTDGHEKDTWCLGCNNKIADGAVIPATEHANAEYVAEVPATCVATGVKAHYVCAECNGAKYLEKTKTAVAQTEKDLELAIDSNNHVSDGSNLAYDEDSHWGTCDCGALIEDTPHYGGTATCVLRAVCQGCNQPYGELKADNHAGEKEVRDAKACSCTEDGYTGDTWCLDCQKMITKGTVIPAAHTFNEGVVTKEPTLKEEGEKLFTCTICGHTKTEVIEKISNPPVSPVGPNVTDEPETPVTPDEPEVTVPTYSDVKNEWFAADVEYVTANGLMNGVGDGTQFGPNMNTTRGMIVTILWRMEGQPEAKSAAQFSDVTAGAYYDKAVVWASEKGIVNGYGATFGPNDNITREQFATILFRYAQYKGYDVSVGEDTNILSYADAFSVSEYAIPAMQWACGAGLINGIGDTLQPAGVASRAQAAAILHRFCENVK